MAARTGAIMADRGGALSPSGAMTALLAATLPERDAHPGPLRPLARAGGRRSAGAPDWPARYAAWELALLAELGFGLDLARLRPDRRASDGLAWVSPRRRAGGQPGGRRALGRAPAAAPRLPARRLGDAAGPAASSPRRWALTGHFLELQRRARPAARGAARARARGRSRRSASTRAWQPPRSPSLPPAACEKVAPRLTPDTYRLKSTTCQIAQVAQFPPPAPLQPRSCEKTSTLHGASAISADQGWPSRGPSTASTSPVARPVKSRL